MHLNPQMFRAYDLRGVVDQDLSPQIMEILGKAYGTFLARRRIPDAVVGSDCRLTSEEYRAAFIKGLSSVGIDVIDLGLCQIHHVYFAQYLFQTNGGAMITASHNPINYNGLKLAWGYSSTLIEPEMKEFYEIARSDKFFEPKKQGTITKGDFWEAYQKDVLKRVKIDQKFKVVVDASNTAAGKFIPEILRRAGCEVIEQNCKIDGRFPSGTPDPTERAISERLAKRVIKEKADIGFSYDSDGDRMGVVADDGTIIWNDVLVAIFADDILSHLPGAKIVYNALCSQVVTQTIKKAGGIGIMWLTGHSFIKQKVALERAAFGGELSGHFFFVDNFYGHDDGCYATLRILEYLSNRNLKLSQALAKFPKFISSPEIKIGSPDDKKVGLLEKIKKDFKKEFGADRVNELDGARVDFSDGMMIIRYSQNGPYITIKFEAKDQKTYQERRKYILSVLKKYPNEIDWSFGVNLESLK